VRQKKDKATHTWGYRSPGKKATTRHFRKGIGHLGGGKKNRRASNKEKKGNSAGNNALAGGGQSHFHGNLKSFENRESFMGTLKGAKR